MRSGAQGEVWRFITLYKAGFRESLSYIRLMQEGDYREAALERAVREGDGELRLLAQRLRNWRDDSPGTSATGADQGGAAEAESAAGDRAAALAAFEQRLDSRLAAGEIDLDARERLDRLAREHGIDLRDAAVLETRLRRQRKLPPLDWRREFAACARGLRTGGELSEYDRLRLYDTYLKHGRLTSDQAEQVLEALRRDQPPPAPTPRRLPWLVGGGALAGLVLAAGLLALGGDDPITAPARITTDTTWPAGATVRLAEVVMVEPGRTLTIEPGVQVLGDFGSALIVPRGARLQARGRADAPIVFTSAQPVGERRRGDWGGVALLGGAPVNTGTGRLEGLPPDDPRSEFGGEDPDYSCGVLEYARIEFAGFEIAANNELNGLTVGGCGRGTVLRHLQVHRGLDDGIEFFGGTADLRNALITGSGDDGLDWDLGWQGRVQHLVIQQFADDGDNAIEADNLGSDHDASPRSAPTLFNVTFIGGGPAAPGQRAMTLREGTAGRFHNVIAQDFPLELLDLRDAATAAQARSGALAFRAVVLGAVGEGATISAEAGGEEADDAGFREAELFGEDTVRLRAGRRALPTPQADEVARFVPAPGLWPDTLSVPPPRGEFWDEAARYPGAVAPGAREPWYAGWSAFPDA